MKVVSTMVITVLTELSVFSISFFTLFLRNTERIFSVFVSQLKVSKVGVLVDRPR